MLDKIEQLNKAQLGGLKSYIQNAPNRYRWEDSSLLSLLVDGISHIYPRYLKEENRDEESFVVREANKLIDAANSNRELYQRIPNREERVGFDSHYAERRLSDLRISIIEKARIRKGVLLYGMGGIGKTFFVYELAGKLSEKERPYALAFNGKGVMEIAEIGIDAISANCKDGFTLILDACNELSEDEFEASRLLIKDALAKNNVNVIVTTREESPTSHLVELRETMPISVRFEGVDPYHAIEALMEFPDSIVLRYMHMLFMGNPRNINAMLRAIKELQSDGTNMVPAHAQLTTLIEQSVKTALDRNRWEQTKKVCKQLYENKKQLFTYDECVLVLGVDADSYIDDMLSEGFIVEAGWETLLYRFSSESQMQTLVARFLNDDLDAIAYDASDPLKTAQLVAKTIADKASSANSHEMCQVAADRYCAKGVEFLLTLLSVFEAAHIRFDGVRILRETVLPEDEDFSTVAHQCKIDPCQAMMDFGGYPNTPFNLMSFANEKLLSKPDSLSRFFVENWSESDLAELTTRVKCLASFVANSGRVPNVVREEWLWLSIWCAASSNKRLRGWSQRLMFALCDSVEGCVETICSAWDEVPDVYSRRAIARVLSHLGEEARALPVVRRLIDRALHDDNLTDSIAITYLCEASIEPIGPTDFHSLNYVNIYGGKAASADEMEALREIVWRTDALNQGYLPFDVLPRKNPFVDFGQLQRFLDAPKDDVREYNRQLSEKLNCPEGGECAGYLVSEQDLEEFEPMGFPLVCIDEVRLLNTLVHLVKREYCSCGGSLEGQLGNFRYYDHGRDSNNDPNQKPLDIAAHGLIGSLSSNYFLAEAKLCSPSRYQCGFEEYREMAYQEPDDIHSYALAPSPMIENAKAHVGNRLESPQDKPMEWFCEPEWAKEQLLSLLKPVRQGGVDWIPLRLVSRRKCRDRNNLKCSNEVLITSAFRSQKHIDGTHDDRFLTIELDQYDGNLKDYLHERSALCKFVPRLGIEKDDVSRSCLVLPPSDLVRHLGIEFSRRNGGFVDANTKRLVIACDGGGGEYYSDPVSELLLIRRDIFDDLARDGLITYFAFTERFTRELDESAFCSFHWEFLPDGKDMRWFPNGFGVLTALTSRFECEGCFFSREAREERWRKEHPNGVRYCSPSWLEK